MQLVVVIAVLTVHLSGCPLVVTMHNLLVVTMHLLVCDTPLTSNGLSQAATVAHCQTPSLHFEICSNSSQFVD